MLERGEGSVAFRPILKVKGEVQDLGEYNSEKEAAIAYDVVKLKVAIEHGLDPATLKLNHSPAAFEGHPLFSYLLRECTLNDTCRLLREGLVEEFLEKERPRRQAALRAEATAACGDAMVDEEEDLPSDIAAPQRAAQLPMPQQQCSTPAAGGSSQSPAPSPSQGTSLRSTWAEEPAGSGRFLINVSARVLRMHELSLPVSVRQALFGLMPSGSSITICSASEDDRWLAEYYEYARSQNCTKACLRQLQSLTRDGGLEVGDVLAFRQGRRPGELTLEVHSRESQVASGYISSLAVSEAPISSPSGGTPPSTAGKKRSSPAQLEANPVLKKQRSAAADKENSPGGAAEHTALHSSAGAETPATAAQSRGVLSPKQPKLLAAPGSTGRASLAKPASAEGGGKTKAAAVTTPTTKSRPSSSKARTSWAEFPAGSGAHTVVLSESACRNSNLNITVYRAGQVFGEVVGSEVAVHSTDTGKQHRWTHKQYASNTNQVYLHALTEYMQSVKANPGDVLSLKHVSQGTADVTLWRKGSENAKAFMVHLNYGQADVSPPAKTGGAPGSAAKAKSPPASQKKQKQKKEAGAKQPSSAGASKPAATAKAAETKPGAPVAKPSSAAATRPGRRERRPASAPATANRADEKVSEPEAAAAADVAPVPSEAAPPNSSVLSGPAGSSEQRPAGAFKKAATAEAKPAAAAAAAVEADPAAATIPAPTAFPAAVALAQLALQAAPAKGPSTGRLTRQAAATQQGSAEAKPTGKAKPPSSAPLAAEAQAMARQPLAAVPKPSKVSPPAAVKLFLHAGKAVSQAAKDTPTAQPSHGMPPPSSIAAVVKRAPTEMLRATSQAVAAAPAKHAPARRGPKQMRGGGSSLQVVHHNGVLTRRGAVAHAAGYKRPRKQPSPHRAATGEPNTLAYAAAVVAVSQLPNKRQRVQLGGEEGGIKDVAGQEPSPLPPLDGSHAQLQAAATGCCLGMGCAKEPSAAGGSRSLMKARQTEQHQQQRRPLQQSSHATQTNAPSAPSTQSCAMPEQQVQLPPAAPENLAPHDMHSMCLNMAKVVDDVVDKGQLSLGAAAAFRRRFVALAEPSTSWQHYSFLHKLWSAGEWVQLGAWVRAAGQA